MKKLNFKILLVALIAFTFSSCEKWIDTSINTSPDLPTSVPMKFIVPSIQVSMAYHLGGNDAVKVTNEWMQYFDGVDRQSLTAATYLITPSDVNNLWNGIYSGELMDAKRLIKLADEQKSPAYAGVAKICIAWTLGESSNLWGALPYSDAFQGSTNLTPVFDKQSTIYNTMRTLLTEAIDDLGKANAIALSGDLVYGNKASQWVKAAHSLLARLELNLSKIKGDAAYTAALAHISTGFQSNADDFQVPFGSAEPNANPIYQFMRDRGDIVMGSTFTNKLKVLEDPRLPFYAKKGSNGDLAGSDPGSMNSKAALPGSYCANANSPVICMSYCELKFIEAECKLKTDPTGALAAFKAAVAASVLKVTGAANTAWLDASINKLTSVTLQQIIEQKYYALYAQNQPYTDFRRTGFPNFLVKPLGSTRDAMPLRFPYPQEEVTYNSANIPAKGDLNGTMWIVGGEDVGAK